MTRKSTPDGSGASSTVVLTKRNESMPATLKSFTFTLVLAGVTEITDDIANALYDAGCSDAGVGSCEGIVSIDFDREAESLSAAIGSAVADVERAGFKVARIDVSSD
jgi:hypothetical protein